MPSQAGSTHARGAHFVHQLNGADLPRIPSALMANEQGWRSVELLSPDTQRRLAEVFPETESRRAAAEMLAHECGNNLPFLEKLDAHALERWRFAALKLSGGDLAKLRQAVELAKHDWRDLLMTAEHPLPGD